MRAAVHDRYGPPEVLRVEEVDRPVPKSDELLVRVRAATVNRTDCGWRIPRPFFVRFFTGLRRPRQRILGSDFAGEVAEVGRAVTRFRVGDAVFGQTRGFGANAEYVVVRESGRVASKPDAVSFEEAASVCEGAFYALASLRKARVGEGQRVVVYGASGAIGTAGVQLAKHLGAHVTAVCNTENLDVVRSLGPDRVLDYTQEDFTALGERFDVVFDAVGKHSFRRSRRALTADGVYVTTDLGYLWHVPPLAIATRLARRRRAIMPTVGGVSDRDIDLLRELIEAGKYRPVVDRTYPLEHVAEATRYVETGQKTGNVVLTV
ncbi:MAG: NAD(P)-dependent alcohol dehydrogenase [Thermoleophilia bacterium]|nr:NAD(P)-dependent alcohol dehydrogenase [Thermoleophilia bacterium]